MLTMDRQHAEYQSTENAQRKYTHPLDYDWMKNFNSVSAVLDFGCGYGRLTPKLIDYGFSTVVGYDISVPLIHQAFFENSETSSNNELLQLTRSSFDLVICFALFGSCPSVDDQLKLAAFISNHTNPNAYLYISDYETVDNPNFKDLYEQRQLDTYGCFESSGKIFRHHEPGHFENLFFDWEKLKDRPLPSTNSNGGQITIHQYLFQKRN